MCSANERNCMKQCVCVGHGCACFPMVGALLCGGKGGGTGRVES